MPRERLFQRDVPAVNSLLKSVFVALSFIYVTNAQDAPLQSIFRDAPEARDLIESSRTRKHTIATIDHPNRIASKDVRANPAPADIVVAADSSSRYEICHPRRPVHCLIRDEPLKSRPKLTIPTRSSVISSGFTSPLQHARNLGDWDIEDFVLLATVDGKLHGRTRLSGKRIWTIESEQPMIETIHYNNNYNHQQNGSDDFTPTEWDNLIWAIEPSRDGNIYLVRGNEGLIDAGITMKEATDNAPRADTKLGVNFVGKKETTMYKIDAGDGRVRQFVGFTKSPQSGPTCSNSNGLTYKDNKEGEECKPNPTFMLGRTEYTVKVTGLKDNHEIAQLKFAEWVPNGFDQDLQKQNTKSLDQNYIRTSHDGWIKGERIQKDGTRNTNFEKTLDSSPVARVFDVMRPHNPTEEDELIVLPQPIPPPDENNALQQDTTLQRIFLNHTEAIEPDNTSWYALSESNYPGVVDAKHQPSWSKATFVHGGYRSLENLAGLHAISINEEQARAKGFPTKGPAENLLGITDGGTDNHVDSNASADIVILQPPTMLQKLSNPFLAFAENSNFSTWVLVILLLVYIIYSNRPSQMHIPRFVADNLSSWTAHNKHLDLETQELLQTQPLEKSGSQLIPQSTTIEVSVEPMQIATDDKVDILGGSTPSQTDEKTSQPVTAPSVATLEVPLLPSPDSSAENDEKKKKRKRGTRGGKMHKRLGARDRSASVDGSQDPQPKRTDDDAVKTAKQLPRETKIEADIVTKSQDPSDISDSVIQVGGSLTVDLNKRIGTGSNGTLVFEGQHHGRKVAVKRMQVEFYDIASQETKLLEESDGNENVIRYYTQVEAAGFLYIALELCPASLAEVIDRPQQHHELANLGKQNLTNVLYQITNGVRALHKLRIVHRDLKPQNILVTTTIDGKPRLLVSDFGLCKKLEGEQSSFRATTAHAAGTTGWRAPELLLDDNISPGPIDASTNGDSSGPLVSPDLLPNRRATRAIDIFSLGLIFFYVLTGGSHPFDCGDRYMREANIRNGKCQLDELNVLGSFAYEAKDLIKNMLVADPKERLTAENVMLHPFFWNAEKRLQFLCEVSDHFEKECRDPPSEALSRLEAQASEIIPKHDFLKTVGKRFSDSLGKQRKYTGNRVLDLLRALRNKKNHYEDMDEDLRKHVGALPGGYLDFWTLRFPNLLTTCWYVVYECNWDEENRFYKYYHSDT